MIEKLSHHYSMENPASVYDEEALTALELAGRTTAKVNETVEAFNNLNESTTERLAAQDKELSERLDRQDNVIIPQTVANRQQELIDNGTFSSEINNYAGNLSERVSNLAGKVVQGSTSMDAEIIDLRTDHKSITHTCAGDALRKNMEHLYNSLDRNYDGMFLMWFNWVQGGINTETGATDTSANRIRTTNNYATNIFKDILISSPSGIDVGIVYYYAASGTTSAHYECVWLTGSTRHIINQSAKSFRLIAKRADDSAILPSAVQWLAPRCLMRNGIGDFLPNLRSRMLSKHYAVDDSDITPELTAAGGIRWFVNGVTLSGENNSVIPAGSYIRNLTVPTVNLNGHDMTIGIWYKIGTKLYLQTVKTVTNIKGKFTIDLNWYAESDALVSLYSDHRIFKYSSNQAGRAVFGGYNLEATTLDMGVATDFGRWKNMSIGATLEYETITVPTAPTLLEVGPGRQFAEIRDAVESIEGNAAHTIMVYPRETPYKNFSMIRKISSGEVYPWNGAAVRNISIIGIDRVGCVVESKTGDYYDPPCEPLCNGTIRNLTFKATHTAQNATATQGSYAAHIDCRTIDDTGYDMRFENCAFISDSAPGAGIGLHQNCKLTFKGCEFYAEGDPDYTPHDGYSNIVNYGAIFAHSSTKDDITGQRLTLDNCRIFARNANKGLWLTVSGENADYRVTAFNNIIYTYAEGSVKTSVEDGVQLEPASYGNNAPEINGA